MKRDDDSCCEPGAAEAPSDCCATSRRGFLKQVAAVGALGPVAGVERVAQPAGAQTRAGARRSPATPAAPSAIRLPRTLGGPQLARVAFPLGGIGTGTISLGGRGQLRDWEIWNEPDKGYTPNYAFASVWAQVGAAEPVARILEADLEPPYEGESGLDWANAPGLPRLESCVFHGEYPFARVEFADDALPVEIDLEAWNPLVPLDAEASGLPVAILRYRIRNPGAEAARIALAYSLDNPLLQPARVTLGPGARREDDGRVNTLRSEAGLVGLVMTNPKLAPGHAREGSIALAVAAPEGAAVTHLESWRPFLWTVPVRGFWEDFAHDGALDPALHRVAPPPGEVPFDIPRLAAGSVCVSCEIAPGDEAAIVYILAWHFPNRTPEICGWRAPKGDEKTVIGNWYTTRFADAWEAAAHAASRLEELERSSRAFVHAMKATDAPEALVEAALANLSVLRTNTCFRTADGRFHGFEGCKEKGCCFGSCNHVWNYDGALAFLFPEFSRSVRELELGFATDDEGRMDMRYMLPYGKERLGQAAADGQMGVLVKLYLDWRLQGDLEWLRRQWPGAKRALEFAWIEGGWDADRDGVMEGCQHNTYDCEFFGPNPLCGVLYLAALRAGEELAAAVGDREAGRRYRTLFERGSAWIDANLFNGEYYVQRIQGRAQDEIARGLYYSRAAAGDTRDPLNQMGEGCLADQVFGQVLAHVADLGYLLDAEKVRASLDAVYRHNFKQPLEDHVGLLRTYALNDESGVVICDYGAKPATGISPFFYHSEVWSGIEYEVAAHLFHEGRSEQALEIVRAVRARHDGTRRNPWNEAECGHHYVRSLASWLALWTLTGFHYHGADARIRLRPRLGTDPARGFWCVPTGWGNFQCSLGAAAALLQIRVEHGTLACGVLELDARGGSFRRADVELGDRPLRATVAAAGDLARVELGERVTIGTGESLTVRVS